MVKIWKRSLSMLLAVMMIFSMMPMQAIAAELEEIGTDDTSIVEPETPEEEPEVPEEEPEEPEEPEHSCEFSAVVTDPTCTDGGYTTYTCECGEVYTADEVEALGHSFEEGTCTACGAADPDYEKPEEEPTEEPTDAPEEPEHTCEFTSVVTDPTCTEGGYTTYTCACGDTYTADEVDALGHSFEEGFCTVCGEEDPDYKEELSGETRIIYFHNAEGWEEVYAAWSFDEEDFEDVEFPGEKMKDETELEDVWFVELPVEADDVLFSDGIEVTEELLAAEKEAGLEVIHEIAAELETKLSKDLYQNEEWTNYEDAVDALEEEEETEPPVMDKAPETTDPVQKLIDSLPASVSSQEEYDAVYAVVNEIEENGYDLTAEQMDAVFAAMNAADEWFGVEEEAGSYVGENWYWKDGALYILNGKLDQGSLYSILCEKYGNPTDGGQGFKYGGTKLSSSATGETTINEGSYNIQRYRNGTGSVGKYIYKFYDESPALVIKHYYVIDVSITGPANGAVSYNGATYSNGAEFQYFPGLGKDITVNDVDGWIAPEIAQPTTSGTLTVTYTEDKADNSTVVAGEVAADVTVTVNGNPIGAGATVAAGDPVVVTATYTGSSKNIYISSFTVMDGTTNVGGSFAAGEGKEYVVNVATDAAIKLSSNGINYNTTMSTADAEAAIKNLVTSVAGATPGEMTVKYWHYVNWGLTQDQGWTALSQAGTGYKFGDAATEKIQISCGDYVWEGDISLTDNRAQADIQVNPNPTAVYYLGMEVQDAKESLFNAVYNAQASTPKDLAASDVTVQAYLYAIWVDVTGEIRDVAALDILGNNPKIRIVFNGNDKFKADTSDEVNVALNDPRADVTLAEGVEENGITVSYQSEDILNDVIKAIGANYDGVSYLTGNNALTADALKAAAAKSKGNTLEVTVKLDYGDPQFKHCDHKVTVSFTDAWYTVTWQKDNGETVDTTDALIGTAPDHAGIDKNADAQYTYTFASWEPVSGVKDGVITGDAAYKAAFDKTVNKYNVRFVNEDGSELQSGELEYGATPSYTGETPTKAADAQYSYTFAGWDKEIAAVTGAVTYTATYDETVNEYEIIFKSHDGEEKVTVKYGVVPAYTTPEDYADGDTFYAFQGWNPAVVAVVGEATYEAVYTNAKIYKVTFDANGGILTEDNVKRVIDGEKVAALEVKYEGYRFDGWYLNGEEYDFATPVTGDITLTAKWVKLVTVSFDVEGVDKQTFDINGKATKPADPTKDQAIFGGWYLGEDEYDFDTPVTEDITLTAKWVADLNRNGVDDNNETITIVVKKAIVEGEKVDAVEITGVIEKSLSTADGTKSYVFDSNNRNITITATPVVTDGISASYVTSIEGAANVSYNNFIATAEITAENNAVITVNFAKGEFDFNEGAVMNYYDGMKNVAQKDLYDIIAKTPTYAEADEVTITYKAREPMSQGISLESLNPSNNWVMGLAISALKNVDIGDVLKDGKIWINMDALWLPVDVENKAPFPEEQSISLDLAVKSFVDGLGEDALSDLLSDAWDKVKAGDWDGAGQVFTDFFAPVVNSATYYGAHRFGFNATGAETVTEEIKLTYRNKAVYLEDETTVELKDFRKVTTMNGNNINVAYRDYTDEDIFTLVNPTVIGEDGTVVADAVVTCIDITGDYTIEGKGASETAIELTFKFAGNDEYRPTEQTFTVTVGKADLSIDLPNLNITYGDKYEIHENIVPGNAYCDMQEVKDSLLEVYIGMDASKFDVSDDGTVTAPSAHVQIILPKNEMLDGVLDLLGLDVYGEEGETMDFAKLQDILGKLDGALGAIDSGNEIVDSITSILESVTGMVDLSKLVIKFGGQRPTDVGIYLYGAVSTSANYETAYDVAYMLILPETTEYTLEWNNPALNNAMVTMPVFQGMDLGAHVVEGATKDMDVDYVILGINTDSSGVLSGQLYENINGNVWLSNGDIKDNGVYLQIAYGVEWGNEFEYAMPIVRGFAVVPAVYDVQLVGKNGTPNDELLKEFNNEPQGFSVIVKNDNDKIIFSDHYQNVTALKDNAQLIVNYTGVQTNGQLVNLTTVLTKDNKNEPIAKPVHAGVYAATVFYAEFNSSDFEKLDVENLNVEDLYKLFNLADAGMDAALLVIEPTESNVTVEDKIVKYNGTDIFFKDMVDAGSTVKGLKPDTTIITAGIDTDAAFSENGWDAIRGIVNVDFPAWMDELLDQYAPEVKAGMSVAQLKDVLLNKLPDITAKLVELGATDEMVNSLTNLTGNVTDVLAEIPDNVKLSFIDDAKANEIGAYIVTAVVTDSDHYPSVDSGYLIVLPDVDMFELKWNYEDGNGIFTRDLLQHVDLLAKAYDAKSGAYNEDATGEISYMFVGIDSNGEFKHYTNAATLPNGAYIQMAYIELDIEGEMVISDMIARPIVVVASNCNVNVENVETVFDNAPHGVNVTVTDLEGNSIEGGEFTILYAGLQTNGKAYLDTAAPVHAGVYEALVTYTKTVDGELRYYGANVGYVLIDLAESEIAVTGDTVTYDGNGHTAQVEITKGHPNADYTLISGGAYVSGDINEVGLEALHGNVNIDLPRWLDEALAEYEFTDGVNAAKLADYIQAYRDELIAAVKTDKLVDWNIVTEEQVNAAVEKLNAYIDELVAVLDKLPTDVALTFESDITYTEPGYYFYYGIVTDSDHYPSTADADWKILPAEITSVEVVGEYTYNGAEQTVELLVKAGEMTVYAGDYKVTGNTATDAGEYTVTISGIGNFAGVMDAKWTINKRAATITITPETATMVAGNAVPEFGATVEGTVNGDELNYTITTVDGKTAGKFSIGAELGNNPNYDVTVVPATLVVEVAVARINDVYYAKLSDAIAEVKNGETIVLLTTIGENVTIKQTAGKSFSIDGNGQTYTGTISIDGNKRSSGAETLTIENTNFVISGEWTSSIATSNQAHNITVESCSFTGTDKGQYGIVLSHSHNIKVENTTGTELYDLVYGKNAVTGFTAENVEVTNSKNGIWLSYVNSTATFKNLKLYVTEVGVGIYNNAKGTATFEDNTIKAETPVYLGQRNDQTKNFTLTFNGTNNLSSTDENGALIFVSGTDPVFKAVMNDTSVNMDQTKGLVAKIGNVYYNTLQHAVDAAKDGETVIVVADHEIECDVNPLINVAGKNITIDLNGKKITANAVAADATRAIFKTESGAKLTVKDTVRTGSVVANGDGVLHYMFRNEGEMIIESGNFTLAAVNGGGMFYSTNDNMQVTGGNFTQTTNGWMFNTEGNSEHVIPVTGGTYNRYFIGGASVTPQENTRGEVVIPEQYGLQDNKNGTWTVVHRVVVVFDDVTVSYGETPNFTYTIKDNGWAGYNVTVETPVVDAVNAGVYENVITAKATVNDDFVVDVVPGTLTINKAEITVTVDDVKIAVDDKIPAQDAVDPARKLTYTVTVGNTTVTGADLEALIAKLSDELKVEITATVEQNDAQQNIPGTYENDVKYVKSDNYVVTVVKGNVIVELGDYICWNTVTGEYFNDVTKAFDDGDTASGHTIQMLADATASFNGKNEQIIIVAAGTTFDLNGYYVEAANLLSFGVVMDSAAEVTGGVKISNDTTKAWTMLQPTNGGYLPIYDTNTGSYKFYAFDMVGVDVTEGTADSCKFRFRIDFSSNEAYGVLGKTTNSGAKVVLQMAWPGIESVAIEYTMSDSTIKGWSNAQYTSSASLKLTLKVHGLAKLPSGEITAIPTVVTQAGVTDAGAMLSHPIG